MPFVCYMLEWSLISRSWPLHCAFFLFTQLEPLSSIILLLLLIFSTQFEINENYDQVPYFLQNSSSHRSISSIPSVHSRISGGRYVREMNFSDLGSEPGVRQGSRGAGSEEISTSYKEISDDDARLIYINDPGKTNDKFEHAGNFIRTGKYSILTFLPRNLFEQFHRVAYIYFLVIAILNQLPQLAVFGRGASIMPLAFVLLVTAIKDAYEDYSGTDQT